jgi:hypothetical protein
VQFRKIRERTFQHDLSAARQPFLHQRRKNQGHESTSVSWIELSHLEQRVERDIMISRFIGNL